MRHILLLILALSMPSLASADESQRLGTLLTQGTRLQTRVALLSSRKAAAPTYAVILPRGAIRLFRACRRTKYCPAMRKSFGISRVFPSGSSFTMSEITAHASLRDTKPTGKLGSASIAAARGRSSQENMWFHKVLAER